MIKRILLLIVFLKLILFANIFAQDDFKGFIEKVTAQQIDGYSKPFITAFSSAINSGLYHTAETHKIGGFDLTIKGVGVIIPDKDKIFTAYVPPGGNQEWSTIFGPKRDDNLPIENINPGGMDVKLVPMAVPQLSFGLGNNFEIMIRFLKFNLGDFGDISLYGIGLKHNIKKYLLNVPLFPDISIQTTYQMLKAGDIVDSKSFAINTHLSENFLIFTIFSGLGYESTNVNLNYTVNDPGSEFNGNKVTYSTNEKNNLRFVGGLRVKLGLLSLNGEINLGKYNSVSAGIGITFR
jgi:hypothetical protein